MGTRCFSHAHAVIATMLCRPAAAEAAFPPCRFPSTSHTSVRVPHGMHTAPFKQPPAPSSKPCRTGRPTRLPCSGRRLSLPIHCTAFQERPVADNTEALAASIQGRTGVLQLYRSPGLSPSATNSLLRKAQARVAPFISSIDTEVVRGLVLHASGQSTQRTLFHCHVPRCSL